MKINAVRLSYNPRIYVVRNSVGNPYSGVADVILSNLDKEEVYFLIVHAFAISKGLPSVRLGRKSYFDEMRAKYPNAHFIALCNDEFQAKEYEGTAVKIQLINNNAFLDENIFNIKYGMEKKYRAIYNAQLKRFKRHYLAAQVERLALIYYGGADSLPYFNEVRSQLVGADFLNGDPMREGPNLFRFFTASEISRLYSESCVGLALSEAEGGMYASTEYLLSGLPVVSTKNVGGRDEFADPAYWLNVDPDPGIVRNAVEELISRNIDPEIIRSKTLNKVYAHRRRLCSLVDEISEEHGIKNRNYESEFSKIFRDKIWKSMNTLEELLAP